VKLSFPAPEPPSGLPAVSTIESSSTRFRPSVPFPEPVPAVTVYVLPLPLTLVTAAPMTPEAASAKSLVSTPATLSLKVTVHWTLAALVGLPAARSIELTVGGVTSVTTVTELLGELVAVQVRKTATTT
jgi:hypothetical protein